MRCLARPVIDSRTLPRKPTAFCLTPGELSHAARKHKETRTLSATRCAPPRGLQRRVRQSVSPQRDWHKKYVLTTEIRCNNTPQGNEAKIRLGQRYMPSYRSRLRSIPRRTKYQSPTVTPTLGDYWNKPLIASYSELSRLYICI
jgi:hypothetical protein